jgi:ribosomal protein S18 acetylase RimI-like enzyme
MEILDLRHFGSAELRPLLTQEAEVWEQRMQWDYHSAAEMVLRYLDSKILPGYAAVQDGNVKGYAFFVYEHSKGVIGDVFAHANGRLKQDNLEKTLLRHCIETLQNSPGINRIEAQLLLHDSGALADPFIEEGFRRYARLFMVAPLRNGVQWPRETRAEFKVRPWTEADFQPAAQIIIAAYAGHIDSEINDQYRTTTGSLRFLNNIIRFPGCGFFDPQSSFVAVHEPTRTIAGLLLCSRVRNDVGHVTQVCVLPQYRGRNLARAMLAECAGSLRRRNFDMLTLTVTEANAIAGRLYQHMGFETRRVFDAYTWEA